MPLLKLQYPDGSEQERELSRSQPLSIGRQSFNDVCVPEDGVGAMHCRISWNKAAFEVTAATASGIDVNGTSVARATLQSGDVIRVGSLDLVYLDPAAVEIADAGFKLVEETDRGKAFNAVKPPPPIPTAKSAVSAVKSSRPEKPHAEKPQRPSAPSPVVRSPEELSLFEGDVFTQSQALPVAAFDDEDDDDDSDQRQLPRLSRSSSNDSSSSSKKGVPVLSVPTGRRRPGEQDIFTSPLFMGLSIGGVVLLLVTGIFWFLMAREQTSRLFAQAQSELANGQPVQAAASFETFVKTYPRHSLRRQVDRGLDQALVLKETTGVAPAWKRGLEQLQKLISNHRAESDFAELHPVLSKLSEEIALGAAQTAESARDAELLIVSDEARSLMERYADPTNPPTATLARIKLAKDSAEKAIGKQNTFDSAMTAVETALANQQPIVALAEREKLVRRFADYANLKRVKTALQKSLDLERSVIATDETERAAATSEEEPAIPAPALGLFHTRSRTEEVSAGRVAYVVAKDSCYAVDTVTGELVWRRVIGLDAPFFPLLANATQPSLLLYDARRQSLLCCQPTTGKIIWRLKLDGRPRSAPLVHEGQIYLPTDDRALCRVDLDSGRLTAKVTFSQNVLGPPALSQDGGHLLMAGELAMIYALTMRPLGAAAMTFTDHAAGAITAPPLSMGKLLLLCDNDKADSTRLRVWNAEEPAAPLVELTGEHMTGARVSGSVREPAVLRGNQLVVPSSNEHLAAFSVTDEAGRAGLAPVAQYRVKDGYGGPMFVALGPDRQFWAASSAFRRFEIGADTIRMDQNSQAPGIASQPLQSVGEQFFVGRKAPFHDAATFSAVERERMVSPWRTVVGAECLELVAARGGGSVAVNEAGQTVSLGPNRLKQGGFDLKAASELELPVGVTQPLRATRLHDGRIAVAASGETTQVWIVSGSGQTEVMLKLANDAVVEANPVLFDDGLVVPLIGRLKLLPLGSNKKAVQDWLAPVGEQPAPHWRFLTRLDGNELIACDETGLLTRIQLRATDVPHLAGASKLQLAQPVDVAPDLRGEAFFVADASGAVKQLNARSFDIDGQRTFESPVRGVWSVGESLLVWSGDEKLHAVSPGRELPERWSLALTNRRPAGAPVEWSGLVWVACREGLVVAVDPATGVESQRIELPQTLSLGLRVIGDDLFAVAGDGSLYRMAGKGQP